MPIVLENLRYILDENLLRLGRAMSMLRHDLACIGLPPLRDLLPPGVGDTEWIPQVGRRGWIMITDDRRLRTRPFEARLANEHGLKVVHLHRAGHLTSWDQAVRLISRWPAIERYADQRPIGPWWLSIRSQRLMELEFRPGEVER
jgi:PIN like domain